MTKVIGDRVGEMSISNEGYKMEILAYRSSKDVDILIDGEHLIESKAYHDFKMGRIKNPFHKNVHGVGYMGIGEHVSSVNGNHTKEYTAWKNMLERCYNLKFLQRHPTYANCTVCSDWHNFQNFAAWYRKNYYEIDGEKMELDKDILVKGNKVYSPETCVFVPRSINLILTKSDAIRGDYPIGVTIHRRTNTYVARCYVGNNRRNKSLGYHPTPELAFFAYKDAKESQVKDVANKYRDKIPCKLYHAMNSYEVFATD